MKYLLFAILITTQLYAVTGPGLTDAPPTSVMEKQEELRRGYNSYPREKVNEREDQEEKRVNPLTEKGPKGFEAQEQAKDKSLNDSKSQIRKKQKGY